MSGKFDRLVGELAQVYGPKSRALVQEIAQACTAHGLSMSNGAKVDDLRWSKFVWRTPEPGPEADGIEIVVWMREAPRHGAPTVHDGFGVAFVLEVIDPQGKVLASLWPDGSGAPWGDGRGARDWVDARDVGQLSSRWEVLARQAVAEVTALVRWELPRA
jgi:hypothetical protein